MNSVIKIAFSSKWKTPVPVITAELLDKNVCGPAEAVRYMRDHFRRKSGPLYWRAFELCHSAIRGEVRPEMVRAHFLAACVEDASMGGASH